MLCGDIVTLAPRAYIEAGADPAPEMLGALLKLLMVPALALAGCRPPWGQHGA